MQRTSAVRHASQGAVDLGADRLSADRERPAGSDADGGRRLDARCVGDVEADLVAQGARDGCVGTDRQMQRWRSSSILVDHPRSDATLSCRAEDLFVGGRDVLGTQVRVLFRRWAVMPLECFEEQDRELRDGRSRRANVPVPKVVRAPVRPREVLFHEKLVCREVVVPDPGVLREQRLRKDVLREARDRRQVAAPRVARCLGIQPRLLLLHQLEALVGARVQRAAALCTEVPEHEHGHAAAAVDHGARQA
eukprot:3934708-Rhodomonas_salina.3